VHFEIPYDDKERAEEFYREAFDWGIDSIPEMKYSIVHTSETDKNQMIKEKGTINGGMFKRSPELKNVNIIINVDSIEEAIMRIEENGGKLIREKRAVGDMGFVAYFEDTEGNILGIWENMKK